MKKTFRMLGALALCAVMIPAMTSCGDDDDEPGDNGGGVTIIPGDSDGEGTTSSLRLTSYRNYKITYNSKGGVESIYNNYERIEFSGSTVSYYYDDELEDQVKVSYNGAGYISGVSGSWDESYDGDRYTGSGNVSFTYDGAGHLTKVNHKCSEKGVEDGESFSYAHTSDMAATWNNGLLVSAYVKEVENEDGEVEQDEATATYTYGNVENKYLQVPYALSDVLLEPGDDELFEVLAAIGLMGRGSSMLPSSVSFKSDYSNKTMTCSYGLNANGSISYERVNSSSTYYWGYGTVSTKALDMEKPAKKSFRSLFVKNRK